MKIKIFTYGSHIRTPRWTSVEPSKDILSSAVIISKRPKDLSLYHNDESHFDLLLSKDNEVENDSILMLNDCDYDEADLKEFDNEKTHLVQKPSENNKKDMKTKNQNTVSCIDCNVKFKSFTYYQKHCEIKHTNTQMDEWNCNDCDF